MYAIQLVEPSLSSFRRTSLPDPEPGPGDVLIRLRAAALNYIDVAVPREASPAPCCRWCPSRTVPARSSRWVPA
jgi:NADPH:quinone reductase-like Zn-dependent oxidoreductase